MEENLQTRKEVLMRRVMQLDEKDFSRWEESLHDAVLGTSLSIEEYNQELKDSEDSIHKGEGISHQKVSADIDRLL